MPVASAQRLSASRPKKIDLQLHLEDTLQRPIGAADIHADSASRTGVQAVEISEGQYFFDDVTTADNRKVSVRFVTKNQPTVIDLVLDDAPTVHVSARIDLATGEVKIERQKPEGSWKFRPDAVSTGSVPSVGVPNDDCADAIPIFDGTTAFSTIGATADSNDSCGSGVTLDPEIWFDYTATCTGTLTLSTCNQAGYDTALAVYDACGGTELACNDDAGGCAGFTSLLRVAVTRGTLYKIRVGGFSSASSGTGDLTITCEGSGGGGPSNDLCTGALLVDCNTTVDFNNENATTTGDPGFSCLFGGAGPGFGTMWYKFVATEESVLLDTNLSVGTDSLIALFDDCMNPVELCCSEDEGIGLLSEVCCDNLTIGETYYIQVGSFNEASAGDYTLRITCPCPGPPPNDECEDAVAVAVPSSTAGDNTGATDDIGAPCGVASGPFNNVWYSVVGTGNTMTATTCNAGTMHPDTKISVFCGTCDDLQCVAGNDDDCVGFDSFFSTVTWCSQPGVTYYITVGGFASNQIGPFQLDISDNGVPCSATVQCLPTGACCLEDGTCVTTTEMDCVAQGGEYGGDGTACTENSIVDGSFEGGQFAGNWVEFSTNFGTPICSPGLCGFGGGTGPNTGDFWSWFGGIGAFEMGSVSQVVVIPVGATTLTFANENPVLNGDPRDFMRLTIDGNTEFEVFGDSGAALGYLTRSIDVSGYADGGAHTVVFESTIFGSGGQVSNFFVDDVELSVSAFSCEPPCVVLDFSTEDDFATPLVNGQDVDAGENGNLVNISGLSFNGLKAAIFDSNPRGPNATSQDPDLLIGQGNILIVQEQPGQRVPGIYDRPNDDARGGDLTFAFVGPVMLLSVDIIDVELPGPGQDVTVTLTDGAGRTRTYTVPSGWTNDLVDDGPPAVGTLDLTTLAPQPGVNAVATATERAGFDAEDVVRMTVHFNGSAALDNLSFCP